MFLQCTLTICPGNMIHTHGIVMTLELTLKIRMNDSDQVTRFADDCLMWYEVLWELRVRSGVGNVPQLSGEWESCIFVPHSWKSGFGVSFKSCDREFLSNLRGKSCKAFSETCSWAQFQLNVIWIFDMTINLWFVRGTKRNRHWTSKRKNRSPPLLIMQICLFGWSWNFF